MGDRGFFDRVASYIIKRGAANYIRERIPYPEIAIVQQKAIEATVAEATAQLQNEVVETARKKIIDDIWGRLKPDLKKFVSASGTLQLLRDELHRLFKEQAQARLDKEYEALRKWASTQMQGVLEERLKGYAIEKIDAQLAHATYSEIVVDALKDAGERVAATELVKNMTKLSQDIEKSLAVQLRPQLEKALPAFAEGIIASYLERSPPVPVFREAAAKVAEAHIPEELRKQIHQALPEQIQSLLSHMIRAPGWEEYLTTCIQEAAENIAAGRDRMIKTPQPPEENERVHSKFMQVYNAVGAHQGKLASWIGRPVLDEISLHSGLNIMMVGPAGSGKTTIAEQIAARLKLPFYFNGPIQSEFKLSGFKDAQGRYHATPFRKAYEFGGVYLFDEIDACQPQALVAFNTALAQSYCDFPDGDQVHKHPCFICLAAANTFGRGGNRVYAGRNQLDGATLDRFTVFEIDYDEDLETHASHTVWDKLINGSAPATGERYATVDNWLKQVRLWRSALTFNEPWPAPLKRYQFN